jgi:hypothetical protein
MMKSVGSEGDIKEQRVFLTKGLSAHEIALFIQKIRKKQHHLNGLLPKKCTILQGKKRGSKSINAILFPTLN